MKKAIENKKYCSRGITKTLNRHRLCVVKYQNFYNTMKTRHTLTKQIKNKVYAAVKHAKSAAKLRQILQTSVYIELVFVMTPLRNGGSGV